MAPLSLITTGWTDRRWLSRVRFVMAALATGCWGWSSCMGQPTVAGEYQIKAVFLFNFVQFATWPDAPSTVPAGPIVIGVLGDDPFGAVLDEAVRQELIDDRPLEVRRFAAVDEIDICHVLFISRSESRQIASILTALNHRPILTVGDFFGFASQGGMIRLVNDQNRIRLRINRAAAQRAGLTLSSNLLRAATIVNDGGRP